MNQSFHIKFAGKEAVLHNVKAGTPRLGESFVVKMECSPNDDNHVSKPLWEIVAKMYNFFAPKIAEGVLLEEVAKNNKDQLAEGIFTNGNEEFLIKGLYLKSVNFGQLDYSCSEVCELELTWGFFELERTK